ncbi:MAG: Gfo/Idh/MocA family oxidoreductase [Planctomycetes bacterium]|nr:Gfo/Idh/MocA family oxidoreductase [Planctomycetota bacterium]
MPNITRREALISGAAAFLTTPVLPVTRARRRGRTSPAMDKLGLALIGCGGMGSHNLRQSLADPDTELIAVCDVQKHRTDAWLNTHPSAKAYSDYRELLANPAVDAVIIATPPHWHCLQACAAAAAGKHIYLQKPMTLYPAESIAVRNAVRKHGVVSQVGTQIHQANNYRRVVDWVRSGKLGPIGRVETFWGWNMGVQGIGTAPKQAPPDDIDFEMWLGPAEETEFNALMVNDAAMHCSWMAYSGGWTPGMAPHLLDLPVWALNLGYPEKISALGGRFIVQGDGDAPDTQEMLWQYPNMTMRWHFSQFNHHGYEYDNVARALGIYFHGLNGTLLTNYNNHQIHPQNDQLNPDDVPEPITPDGGIHEIEWLNCIRNGGQPSCCVDYHIKVDLPITLGNLSHALGRTIHFDPSTESIIKDPAAARRAIPEYRGPWKFPKAYLNGKD